jgi:hypothetical protein
MAEKPGGKKPESKKVTDVDAATRLIGIIVGLALVGGLAAGFARLVGTSSDGGFSVADAFYNLLNRTGFLDALYRFVQGPFFWISMLLSLLFAWGALYSFFKYKQLREAGRAEIRMLEAKLTEEASGDKNEKWERIEGLVSSENPGDWRVAIIEADIMLTDLLRSMAYRGDTVGDMLKSVERSDFETLDLAWEAHKVRNHIAHHGSDFILTSREARRVIELFRKVFQEFDVV